MKRLWCWVYIFSSLMLFSPRYSYAEVVIQEGIRIEIGRVLHGATSGKYYLGYTGGTITLPHSKGGMLSFALWNDMEVNGWARTNYFKIDLPELKITIPNYATRNQIAEEYQEYPGQWGAAGTQRVTIGIPPGIASFRFTYEGSATGIELSDLAFVEGFQVFPAGYAVQVISDSGAPLIQVGRILTGEKTGQQYYGYTSGCIYLPHVNGGFLSFKVWNDQMISTSYTLNQINVSIGSRNESFAQYSTSLDVSEYYQEFMNQWGPAGGSRLILQVPEGISNVTFSNAGSSTGIEISEVEFTESSANTPGFEEYANRTSQTLNTFGRVLHGGTTDTLYYGYTSGQIILPNTKGGALTFRLWNDQQSDAQQTQNQLNIRIGDASQTIPLLTQFNERSEFYTEFMNQWGPAGGKEIRLEIPSGIATIDLNNSGSQTGIELSDIVFLSD